MAPQRAKASANKAKPTKVRADVQPEEDPDLYTQTLRIPTRPSNQLSLTDAQLKEEITRVLTGDDPNIPSNVSKYNFKDKVYKVDPPGQSEHMAIHFSLEGCSLHCDSDDFVSQEARGKEREEERLAEGKDGAAAVAAADGEGNAESGVETQAPESGKNQFNYSERAAQTFNQPLRNRGVSTEPPPVTQFSGTLAQWDIFDTYMNDYKAGLNEKRLVESSGGSNAKKTGVYGSYEEPAQPVTGSGGNGMSKDEDTVHSLKMSNTLKILERLVNQNAEDEIFNDFKYWEDASDQFRPGEGSLLPLWRFSTERTKRKQVTALSWNPRYPDLFAVGYGSYDFMRQSSGMICIFSLKNTSFPEYIFSTESGVMCLDFHPQHQSLLAVGCYDGTVMVYDVREKAMRPIYSSSIKTGKHTDPVWQVYWQAEDLAKELNFFSISSDGRVANWIMSKNELKMEPVMSLKLVTTVSTSADSEGGTSGGASGGDTSTSLSGLAGGCCFDFNKTSEHLFIVGTEEGNIHKCSKAYSGQYLETYEGHHMAVYSVKWNPFHPRVFISCSADWTVKIWDHNLNYPIMSFDLGNAVGDVCWSPYSSTIFAAVTSDGKVHVFDLSENKHEPLCEQKVVKRAKLTHVCFNERDFMIIVGDDRGGVNSLKLSPNLRKLHEPEVEEGAVLSEQMKFDVQKGKMERLLVTSDAKPPPA